MSNVPDPRIADTQRLTTEDIGNLPRVYKGTTRPEVYGLMNGELWRWGIQNPLPAGEYDDLADLFSRSVSTVRRWFGQVDTPANCVPLTARGKRPCNMDTATRSRVFLAACLALEGGLCRTDEEGNYTPIFTGRTKAGELYEEIHDYAMSSLAECVEMIEQVYAGDELDGSNLPLDLAWLRIRIYYNGEEDWTLRVWRSFPAEEDESDDPHCVLAQTAGNAHLTRATYTSYREELAAKLEAVRAAKLHGPPPMQ